MKRILRKIYWQDGDISDLNKMWNKMKRTYPKNVLQKNMIDVALEEKTFPYLDITNKSAIDSFKTLQTISTSDVLKNRDWVEIGDNATRGLKKQKKVFTSNTNGMVLSKKFNWKARAHVQIKNKKALSMTWSTKDLETVVDKFWTFAQIKSPTRTAWRKVLSWRTGMPSQFRPAIAKTIYDIFQGKDILDMSAGWGDRLSAALAVNAKSYTGVDPSPVQHRIYKSILAFVRKNFPETRNTKVTLIKSGSENVKLPSSSYDLSFTSPPYFDTEVYNGGKQSHKLNDYEEWKHVFYFPTFDNTVNAVKQHGHIIINVKNYSRAPLVTDIIKYSKTHKNVQYLGAYGMLSDSMIGNTNSESKAEPVLIWKKISN